MKYCITILDGMADYPLKEFNGKTCIEAVETPNIDYISSNGKLGLVNSIPDGFSPGSDVAAMSLLGYDPNLYYTGRAPIEAASLKIDLEGEITACRCNLVTVNNDILEDYSSGHITNEEANILISFLDEKLGTDVIKFHHGISYRHIMTYKSSAKLQTICKPPHDIMGESIKKNMPKGAGSELFIELMEESRKLLEEHEINKKRISEGKNPASMIWLWGQGRKPSMPEFYKTFGIKGAVISAVDLVNGLALIMNMDVIEVPGVTGNIDTDYDAKASYAIKALSDYDLIVVHIEAPDEMGHSGNAKEKAKSIEDIDKKIVGPILEHLKQSADNFRFLVLPDHYTPISIRTHTSEPVPFAMYGDSIKKEKGLKFTEENAKKTGLKINKGYELMDHFLRGNN